MGLPLFAQRARRDAPLWALAWAVLVVCRLLLALLPLRDVARLAGAVTRGRVGESGAAGRVGWAVRSAAARVPGARCLAQALACYLLLDWHGMPGTLVVGARLRPDGRLAAHAWVEYGGAAVIGGRSGLERLTPLLKMEPRGRLVTPAEPIAPRPGG